MIHYMKRAHFTRVFDNIGFKCKIIFHLKISAHRAGLPGNVEMITRSAFLPACPAKAGRGIKPTCP